MRHGRRPFLRVAAGTLVSCAVGCRSERAPTTEKRIAERVVSLSPSTTETLFAVGAGAKVVGRTRFCDYPPEVRGIPEVGGVVDVSFEAVLALTPDLVVGASASGRALGEKFTRVGIATYFPSTESMTEIDAMILELATRVGRRAEGMQVLERLAARRTAISRAVAHEPRVRALLVFGTTPIVVAGPGSFPNELLQLANAENVVTTGSGYPM